MFYILLKAIVTGGVIVGISELSKRSSLLAAILASLPLTSILAMIWIYIDSKNILVIQELSMSIFWMVLPSLLFFIFFPLLLKYSFGFYPALLTSCIAMIFVYFGYIRLLKQIGIAI